MSAMTGCASRQPASSDVWRPVRPPASRSVPSAPGPSWPWPATTPRSACTWPGGSPTAIARAPGAASKTEACSSSCRGCGRGQSCDGLPPTAKRSWRSSRTRAACWPAPARPVNSGGPCLPALPGRAIRARALAVSAARARGARRGGRARPGRGRGGGSGGARSRVARRVGGSDRAVLAEPATAPGAPSADDPVWPARVQRQRPYPIGPTSSRTPLLSVVCRAVPHPSDAGRWRFSTKALAEATSAAAGADYGTDLPMLVKLLSQGVLKPSVGAPWRSVSGAPFNLPWRCSGR